LNPSSRPRVEDPLRYGHTMKYIDFYTHIFPDTIARQTVDALAEKSGDYRPCTDGTLQGLLDSMKRAGISASLIANIATKPALMLPILDFSLRIKSDEIHPLVSFHPSNDTEAVEDMFGAAHREGIRGVKLHPLYQNFNIDDKYMYGFYELMASFGFFVMFHTGFDMAFPGNTQGNVERVKKVADWFKDLTIVCTHVGGFKQWDRIACLSGCNNVYTETSLAMNEVGDGEFVRLLAKFGEDRILFGTDSPWTDQKTMLERTLQLKLSDRVKEKLLYANAAALLGLKN